MSKVTFIETLDADELRRLARDIASSLRCPCGRLGCDLAGVAAHYDEAWRELTACLLDTPADNPHFVNLGEVGGAPAEFISFPLDESLFIHRREVWVGRPGNPESRIVGDIRPDPGHEVAVIVVWRTEDGEVAGGEAADA